MFRNALSNALYALRMMASRPGFTAVVVLTLAAFNRAPRHLDRGCAHQLADAHGGRLFGAAFGLRECGGTSSGKGANPTQKDCHSLGHGGFQTSLGLFSSIALLLALVGLYGMLAYYVSQRNHEIGVRMALGASRRQVAKIVLSRGMGMVAVGLLLGLAGSYWATRLIQQLLFGVEPTDPITFVFAALALGVVALAACLLPAWRATRVDPVIVLQAE